MASEFFVSSDVTFGKNAAKELPRILKEFKAKNVMVVYDAGVKMAGIAEKVLAEVEKADVKVTVFDGVIPNPTNEVVEEVINPVTPEQKKLKFQNQLKRLRNLLVKM